MQFRKAQPKDLTSMTSLISDAVHQFHADGIDQWQCGYPNADVLAEDIRRQTGYVLEEDGQVIGMMNLQQTPDPSYTVIDGAWLDEQPYASFHRVCVSVSCKGRGFAGVLFRAAEEVSQKLGFASVRIDTHADNHAMQRAIEKHGFTFCGTILLAEGPEAGAPRLAYQKLL